jgi:hypothetical protein
MAITLTSARAGCNQISSRVAGSEPAGAMVLEHGECSEVSACGRQNTAVFALDARQ